MQPCIIFMHGCIFFHVFKIPNDVRPMGEKNMHKIPTHCLDTMHKNFHIPVYGNG